MRRNYLIILAAASFAFGACQDKLTSEVATDPQETFDYSVEKTFYGVTDFQSRTILNDEAILWESTDAVRILWGEGLYNKAQARPFNAGASAEFTTTVEYAPAYYGVNPYSNAANLSDGKLNVTIPSAQTGAFADANIAVAKADAENNMTFKHVVSFLEFTIDRTGVLTFSDGISDKIAGVVTVNEFTHDGTPVYEVVGNSSEVTMTIKNSGTYYIALLPDVKIDMLSFTLTDGESESYILATNPIQMAPGKLVGLGNITGKFKDTRQVGAVLESFTITEFKFDQDAYDF